jgi:enoyl-CoA hydratase
MSTNQTRSILVEHLTDGIAKIILNNLPLNVWTLKMSEELIETLTELEADNAVRTIVITGAGDKAFCAGSDIKEFPQVKDNVVEKKLEKENDAFSQIEFLTKPVIAAIEGIACGGGCEITLACDIRIMAENAKIGLPEVKLGVFPGSGGLFRLPRLIGSARALELMYLGNFITAREAEQIGLVNRVVPPGEALNAAISLACEISQQPMESLKAIKRGVRESLLLPHVDAVNLTLELSDHVFRTEDCTEGVSAFFEKRKPVFKGVSPKGSS